jgi:hypothetical protein
MEDFKEERFVDTSTINRIFSGSTMKEVNGLKVGEDSIRIVFDKGHLDMYHSQDCCESVEIEDINGDTNLVGAIFYEIIEKQCDREALKGYEDSYTWTFYTIKTSKGYLDIRWYGASNGYYSERVDLDICYLEKE